MLKLFVTRGLSPNSSMSRLFCGLVAVGVCVGAAGQARSEQDMVLRWNEIVSSAVLTDNPANRLFATRTAAIVQAQFNVRIAQCLDLFGEARSCFCVW